MSSLAELPELVGFFSYSREDDEAFRGGLSGLREGIQRELSAQLGRSKTTLRLWQDVAAIAPGKHWEAELKAAIDGSFFFIPIISPRSVNSKHCQFEFQSFLAREKAIGRNDLVFPILYISVPALENETKWRNDVVLSTIGNRQYVDWRSLRHLDPHATFVREQIEHLCQKIVEALNEPWVSPEERRRMEEAEARRQAEEEARQQEAEAEHQRQLEEAEARRQAEEEARRQEAEAERQRQLEEAKARQQADEEARQQEAERQRQLEEVKDRERAEEERKRKEKAKRVTDELAQAIAWERSQEEQRRQTAETKRPADDKQRRVEGEAWRAKAKPLADESEKRAKTRGLAFQPGPRWRLPAIGVAIVLVLLLIGGLSYVLMQYTQGLLHETELKAKLERTAKATAQEAERRKVDESKPSSSEQTAPATSPGVRPKIPDRLGQPSDQISPVAQRVVLYDEDPSDPAGKRYVGSVIWRTEPVKASGNQKPDIAVRADIDIPDRKFKMTMAFRRNTDSSLPASHTAELTFILPQDFAGGGISNVPGILMKSKEQARGTPLAGLAVKVTEGFFLVGLSNVDDDRSRNLQLLKERSWFDVPLVYTNQRRAIIAIEKGDTGERAFTEAFAAWGQ
ncbi:hypothetical protein ACVIGB_008978 [Bradyrhizobium sp. USDA 4341]